MGELLGAVREWVLDVRDCLGASVVGSDHDEANSQFFERDVYPVSSSGKSYIVP
jgi:hypothetical protein